MFLWYRNHDIELEVDLHKSGKCSSPIFPMCPDSVHKKNLLLIHVFITIAAFITVICHTEEQTFEGRRDYSVGWCSPQIIKHRSIRRKEFACERECC